MDLDHGTSHTIDVQSDLRFPLQYILYNITEQYSDLTTKSHPFVSTFTLAAQHISKSYPTLTILSVIFTVKSQSPPLPQNIRMIQLNLATFQNLWTNTLLVNYQRLLFSIASLAWYSFLHDYGWSVSPSMILAHNPQTSLRTNAGPEDTLRIFYSNTILTVDVIDFTPVHFLAANYLSCGRVHWSFG